MLWPRFVVLENLVLAISSSVFMPNFVLILLALAFFMLLSFFNSSMMEMPYLSFFISSSILSFYVCLGPRAFRLSVYHVSDGHAVAYRTLLILVMLK